MRSAQYVALIVTGLEHLLEPIRLLITHRRMLWMTTLNDLRAKYLGSFFGLAWAFVFPILLMALISQVNINILQVKFPNVTTESYMILVFSGLIPFLAFAEAISLSVPSVVANASLVKNTLFPIDLIPAKAVLTSVVTIVIGLATLFIWQLSQGMFHKTWLLVPFAVVLQLIFMVGLGWILSALNVFFRDIGFFVGLLVMMLMMISPIGYVYSAIPEAMMSVMTPNPLYYLIGLYRGLIIDGVVPWDFLWRVAVMALGTLLIGSVLFRRLKSLFTDFL